jgi:geranylgeranylglycerol-phosphate geranylgeranyltransferase
MGKGSSLIGLTRPVNCVLIGLAVIVGAALADKETLLAQPQNLGLGFLTGFFLTAGAMAINDFYDREIDTINEPKRPIPSGAVSPAEALVMALGLTLVGLSAALVTGQAPNWECFFTALVSSVLVGLYVTKGKSAGLPGNFLVSTCIAVPFVYGGLVIGKELLATTIILVAIAFLSNTGREVTKGIVDVVGDKKAGIETIAVLYGEQRAASVATIFYLSSVSLTPLPWILELVSFWFLPFVLITNLGLVLASIMLILDPSRENARRIKNRVLFWFLTGLIAFGAGTAG